MHRLGDYRGHISIAYQETRPGAVNTLGGGPWPFSAGRPAMAEPGRGGTMGRPSPELGPAVETGAVRACRVADRRRSIPDRHRPEPPADKQRQHQRQRAKQTRPPTHAQGRQQTASTASQAEARHRPASAASTSRAPAKQTRPPAKIPNARDFSSPPLIAIHPLLYPPPARRRVLPAQTRTFAGSRAQKLIRCDAFFSFPAGPGEKMEGGQKIWNAHAGGGARGKRNAGGREIGTGIIFAASRKWWKELARRKLLGRTDGPHAGGGVTPGW